MKSQMNSVVINLNHNNQSLVSITIYKGDKEMMDIETYCLLVKDCNEHIKDIEEKRQVWIDKAVKRYNLSHADFERYYTQVFKQESL